MNRAGSAATFGGFMIAFMVSLVAAWVTHIFWIIGALSGNATTSQIVLGGIGAFMPPVGVIHGFMIWFGAGF